uniref:Adenylate kinase active site lid domain-containing protein n=1 Tax=Colobus angolensis palliatus TaxID=336983 RepID=A0A2K5I6L2_COLAP
VASKLLRAVILAPPHPPTGSGTCTVCQRIAQNFGFQDLSSGHFLRENIKANTEVGEMAKQYIEKSLLVPDHVITRLMMSELENGRGQHWLLHGFAITTIISLKIPFETLKHRLSCCWIHPPGGRVYNMDFNPPHIHGIDDVAGEPLDDKPEAVAARLRRYKDVAKPVIELYKIYKLFSNMITHIQSKEAY